MTNTLTPEEFASLSPNGQLLARIGEAVDRGDHQTAWECARVWSIRLKPCSQSSATSVRNGFAKRTENGNGGTEIWKRWLDRDL
jgi:hypothetical protein